MTYILSLLNSQLSHREIDPVSPPMLCYYINDTIDTQIIRVSSDSICHFERIVFPKERVLFEALSESWLEVHSPFLGGSRTTQSECRLFQVNEN